MSKDHPRSRGVYDEIEECDRGIRGSSPLARGLLDGPLFGKLKVRIIPARAGFTVGAKFSSAMGGDHPRSRGVYKEELAALRKAAGSSPLARGLLFSLLSRVTISRIIPARAGFTG